MLDKFCIEELLQKSDNRYELIDVVSRRAHQLTRIDHSIKVADALNEAVSELLDGTYLVKR
jgi:DNA-directed RNA polymerase omega subunit